ncbi:MULTISPECIES: STAS domain-containing protein [Streptosporangium]|uniref:STAS domain-containing protein n=1 Tax=Streptosporangium TaxID=2000 RepID=UPI0027D86712|nr:STAS domain-containing protein [Streptosporangium brasiliense]
MFNADFRTVIMTIWPEARPCRPPPAAGLRDPSPHDLHVDLLEAPALLRVSGEIDRTTRRLWEEALGGLVIRGEDMHLDFSGLTFVDVRGAWLLTEAARSLPVGKKVFLHHAPYCLRSVLTLIGPDPSPIEVETQ